MVKKIVDGFLAGLCISIGGTAFLMCYPDNKYIGALLFCIGLLSVCWFSFSLYTGKIGFVLENHSKEDISALLLGLLGNTAASVVCGYLLAYAIPNIKDTALALVEAKLAQGYLRGFVRATFCGILIYVAVYIYKNKKSVLGVVLGIPAFIISGYEHSIADMYYFAASGHASAQAFGYIWMIILGNSVGGLLIPALQLLGNATFKKRETAGEAELGAELASDVVSDDAPQNSAVKEGDSESSVPLIDEIENGASDNTAVEAPKAGIANNGASNHTNE